MVHADSLKRIYRSAHEYWTAQKLLSSYSFANNFGNSQPVLSVLTFEILLKCVYLIDLNEQPNFGHDYLKGWNCLPPASRQNILECAKDRYGPDADLSDLPAVLKDFKIVFLRARYSYEKNQDQSDREVEQKGWKWEEAGAPLNTADFRFRPDELSALVFALSKYVQFSLGLPDEDVLRDT